MEYKPGDAFIFKTTRNDLACLNGTKCVVVEKKDDGMYTIEFIGATVSAWADELKPKNK